MVCVALGWTVVTISMGGGTTPPVGSTTAELGPVSPPSPSPSPSPLVGRGRTTVVVLEMVVSVRMVVTISLALPPGVGLGLEPPPPPPGLLPVGSGLEPVVGFPVGSSVSTSVTGQTVVETAMVSVTTRPGHEVTVGAQEVMV